MRHIQGIILIFTVTSLCGCLGTAMYVNAKIDCASTPDKLPPKARYEFPFRLVYEIDGRQSSIEDTQICQFAGNRCINGAKEMAWKETLASGRRELPNIHPDNREIYEVQLCDCSLQVAGIGCSLISPAAHLSLKVRDSTSEVSSPPRVRVVSFEQKMAEARNKP